MSSRMHSREKDREEVVLHGIGVSPGVVFGPVFLFGRAEDNVPEYEVGEDRVQVEIARVEASIIETRRQIKDIQQDLK